MTDGSQHRKHPLLFGRAAWVFGAGDRTFTRIDPDGLRRLTTVLVWIHWAVAAFVIVQLVYRPTHETQDGVPYWLMLTALTTFNGYVHYRLKSNEPMSWRWIPAFMGMDLVLLTGAVVVGGGFNHFVYHLLYYPLLAGYAAVFTSFRLTMTWVTVVSVIYLAISLTVGDGIDIEEGYEKALFARIFVMFTVAALVNLISSFERDRWAAAERERALRRERVEFSQTLHDTAAQSAYMIGLGIDTAKAQAEEGSPGLGATLEEVSRLTTSTVWELRHPINVGGIYEGQDLGAALEEHTSSFARITSIPARLTQRGVEPPLPAKAKGMLFAILHNALTNAYRHAEAKQVSIHLEFGETQIRLAISDDGVGLPDDYQERGRGFANMNICAERLGGRLIVEERGARGGATIACVIPSHNR